MPKICFPDLRGPVRVLGLWIIRGFQRRDTDYWTLNLKITDDFFLESYVRDTLFTKLGSGLFPNLPRIMDYSDPPPPQQGLIFLVNRWVVLSVCAHGTQLGLLVNSQAPQPTTPLTMKNKGNVTA